MKKWEAFSKEALEEIVKNSSSKRDIAEKLGYSTRSHYSAHIEEMLNHYKFDVSHLHGKTNLTGQRFGHLLVTRAGEKKNGKKMWYCDCDCGERDILVQQNNLRSGNSKSCGCASKDNIKKSLRKDLTGQMIGFWQVIQPDEENSTNGTYWFCKCTLCGDPTIHSISAANLLSGKTQSCGCHLSSIKTYKIENFLREKNYSYIKEYTFSDLKSENERALRFDFALFKDESLACLIEYQGEQHYFPNLSWGGEQGFIKQQENDQRKREYCLAKNIVLIEIPYLWNEDEIKQKLGEYLYDFYGW